MTACANQGFAHRITDSEVIIHIYIGVLHKSILDTYIHTYNNKYKNSIYYININILLKLYPIPRPC